MFDPEKYHQEVPFETPLFHTPEIREKILDRGRDYNTFIVEENGKQTLYSFAYLEVFQMYYVVVADYDMLIKHTAEIQKSN